MNKKSVRTALVTTAIAVALCGAGARSLLAESSGDHDNEGRHPLHVTKECSQDTGEGGSFCTITGSDLSEIVIGARVYYDQPAGVPAGLLDSNVVLDAGGGNRALGRCTLDLHTGLGLCTFSDGTGDFAGFRARVKVSPPTDGVTWHWDGFYSFDHDFDN